jgi:hypothetical protein
MQGNLVREVVRNVIDEAECAMLGLATRDGQVDRCHPIRALPRVECHGAGSSGGYQEEFDESFHDALDPCLGCHQERDDEAS